MYKVYPQGLVCGFQVSEQTYQHWWNSIQHQHALYLKKCGVKFLQYLQQMLTDFENSFTVTAKHYLQNKYISRCTTM